MKIPRPTVLLLLPWLAAAAPAAPPASSTTVPPAAARPGTVTMQQAQPGSALDATARGLVAQDLQEARQAGDRPLLLAGQARLGAASDRPAIFVQLQSPRECGSAGCNTSVYLWQAGRYQRVLDGAAGRIQVSAARHRGMADLVTEHDTYVWTGTAYASKDPAPNVDLRPRRPRRAG